MELSKQCVSLELSKRLKELGVEQESLFYWVFDDLVQEWIIKDEVRNSDKVEWYSALNVAELGEMLPWKIPTDFFDYNKDSGRLETFKNEKGEWFCKYLDKQTYMADTEADARAKMLICLIENKFINL